MSRLLKVAACLAVAIGIPEIGGTLPLSARQQDKEDEKIREVQRLTDEALQLRRGGKLPEAIAVWKRRLALIREIVGSENTESVAGSLEMLAEMYEAAGDLTSAARTWRSAREARAGFQGKDHWRVIDSR